MVIVGVASDINIRSLGEAPRDVVYVPYTQGEGSPVRTYLARTAADSAQVAQTLVTADPAGVARLLATRGVRLVRAGGAIGVAVSLLPHASSRHCSSASDASILSS